MIKAKYFLRVSEFNQDFIAPAPSYIPIEVVSVRIREHQHLERTPSGVVFWTAAGRDAVVTLSWNERMKVFSTEAEGGPKGAVELWRRDRGAQMISQNIQDSEQIIITEGQIMSSSKERRILLFNSTVLQGDCHFVEEFFNFEPRIDKD